MIDFIEESEAKKRRERQDLDFRRNICRQVFSTQEGRLALSYIVEDLCLTDTYGHKDIPGDVVVAQIDAAKRILWMARAWEYDSGEYLVNALMNYQLSGE